LAIQLTLINVMEFENLTVFPALAYDIVDPQGEEHQVVVARGTYELRTAPDQVTAQEFTHIATLMAEQPELIFSDVCHGEINRSSVKYESDLAQHKPRCDVIVIGSAHSPSAAPVPRIEVGIYIEREAVLPGIAEVGMLLVHRLVVHGSRAFVRNAAVEGVRGWQVTESEPFTVLPIRYEHAFGGELRIHLGDEGEERLEDAHRLRDEIRAKHPDGPCAPIAHTVCAYNPVGIGWLEGWYANALSVDRWPVPRIEAPGAEITGDHFDRLIRGEVHAGEIAELTPRGFGVIAKPWQPRLARAGTLDNHWLAERWPYMPLDFEMAYWNGAHPDMQCPHLFGGERIELWNLLPPSTPGVALDQGTRVVCRFSLPSVRVGVRLGNDRGQEAWVAARIDTLIIDMEEMRLSVVWRAVVPAASVVSAALFAVAVGDMEPKDEHAA
jgi:hypothetical protein